ncbi:MAG: glucose/arabinose dehydrogenase [Verrucomicrobiales bacterium]|jgi:glucose/arabinose dehydrogenase
MLISRKPETRNPMINTKPISLLYLFFATAHASSTHADEFVLVDEGRACQVLVPDSETSGFGWRETSPLSDPDAWTAGETGVGFDSGETFLPHFNLEVEELLRGVNGSIYVRIPFQANEDAVAKITKLTLSVKYDDGFAAYLNGTLIASANAPLDVDGVGELPWNATATSSHADRLAVVFEDFELDSNAPSLLQLGENILAIHALNSSPSGSDFLISPRLVGEDVFVPVWPSIRTRMSVSASDPVAVVYAEDGTDRLFIVEQRGRIRVLESGELRDFLDITERVRSGGEQGLLGLAFAPGFPAPGKDHFYVNYTRRRPSNDGATVVSRFRLGDRVATPLQVGNPETEEILLTVDQPFENHNGGDMHFGKDDFLYIGLGDGGAGGDPGNRAQNPQNLLGKMLRLDVEGDPDPDLPYAIPPTNPFVSDSSVRGEIWALGLRNPWRWSFDRLTGEMYIGDVGQNDYEEVSYEPAGTPGGLNHGWRRKEGLHDFNTGTRLDLGTVVDPIIEVSQRRGDRSLTGGFVYRGTRFPRMQGSYFFADYVSGRIFGAQRDDKGTWVTEELLATEFGISAFGENVRGELFIADYNSGEIYELLDDRDSTYLQVTDTGYDPSTDAFSFTFGGAIGETYQAEITQDLLTWEQVGPRVTVTEDNAFAVTLTVTRADAGGNKDIVAKGSKILQN